MSSSSESAKLGIRPEEVSGEHELLSRASGDWLSAVVVVEVGEEGVSGGDDMDDDDGDEKKGRSNRYEVVSLSGSGQIRIGAVTVSSVASGSAPPTAKMPRNMRKAVLWPGVGVLMQSGPSLSESRLFSRLVVSHGS